MAAPLSAIIDPLLDLTDRFEASLQTSINTQNLTQLSERIKDLAPVVESLAETDPEKGQTFIERLGSVLNSMREELKVAEAEGKLSQFFNADYNTVIIEKHNTALTRLLTDSVFVVVHDTNRRVRELESECGFGGMGGRSRQSGGEGGHGEGPQLNLEPVPDIQLPCNMRLSGGTGGQGGASYKKGGRGGTGKGPIINMGRRRFSSAPENESPTEECTL
ncbi:hypothetical protein R3P38DRAFT_3330369 [Favolaschia claudopus]|uniref:Uncharacterized protein n=1 Tax=Favolaschia claudopus TaxID=2862362 RepID=A0AAV9ZVI0_9AGAR